MNVWLGIEILATLTSLTFLFLLIRQNIGCWSFAIISALLSISLFVESKLYSEALLYGYYILIEIYGWWSWSRPQKHLAISTWTPFAHLVTIVVGVGLSVGVGFFFTSYTKAEIPYLDAFTTVFSLVASLMEARKILSAWIYWILINGVTVGLYFYKSLDIYAAVMIIYVVMSVMGYREWRKEWKRAGETKRISHSESGF